MKNCLPKLGLFGPRGWLIQRGKERVLEPKTATATHCPYCALQCGMNLVPGDRALTVAPRDFPTNKGGLCPKGWTAAELLSHTERLTAPLMRDGKGAALRPVSWDVALDRVAAAIRAVQGRYGRDAVGV